MSSPNSAPRWWLGFLLVATVVTWTFQEVPGFDFVGMDDTINIVVNPHLGPPSAETLRWMFGDWEYVRRYMPLGWLLFSLVYTFSGIAPEGWHAVALGLHVVNAVLLFTVMRCLFGTKDRAGFYWAGLATLWWALNPLRAEAVAWASALLYQASACCLLTAFLAYMRAEGGARWCWVLLATAAYGAGVLIYPIGVGAIIWFPLWDWHQLGAAGMRRVWRERLTEKLPLLAVAAGVAALTIAARYSGSTQWDRPAGWSDFGLGERLGQMCYSIIYYIWKPWAPFDLSPIPTQLFDARGADPLFWGSIAGVAAITALAFRFRRSVPALACLWLSYVALILPVSGLMDRPYFPVDRYAHLSSLVLAVGLAFLGRRGFAGVSSKGFGIVVALFVLAFVSVTRRQLGVWRNAAVLGEWNLAHARHPEVVVDNLAKRAVDDEHWGRSAAADERLQSAERQFPAHPRLQAARATIEAERRRRTELDIPLAATVHFDLALRRFRQGRLRDAEDHFRASLVIAPDSPVLRYNFAMSLALVGDGRLALAHYGWLPAGRISTEQRSRLLDVIAAAADTAGETRLATAARRVAAELR